MSEGLLPGQAVPAAELADGIYEVVAIGYLHFAHTKTSAYFGWTYAVMALRPTESEPDCCIAVVLDLPVVMPQLAKDEPRFNSLGGEQLSGLLRTFLNDVWVVKKDGLFTFQTGEDRFIAEFTTDNPQPATSPG